MIPTRPSMECEEKISLLAAYQGCVTELTAKLNELEHVAVWQEFSVKLRTALDECDLAYSKFKEHVSEHGC